LLPAQPECRILISHNISNKVGVGLPAGAVREALAACAFGDELAAERTASYGYDVRVPDRPGVATYKRGYAEDHAEIARLEAAGVPVLVIADTIGCQL
jgi:hypothetical protein